MNRTEIVQRIAAHKAAAEALEKRLKGEARRIFDQEGSADTWRMPGTGYVAVNVSRDRPVVVDREALLEWLARRYPTEVEVVVVRRVRNDRWLDSVIASLAAVDPDHVEPGGQTLVTDDQGEVVPGVAWERGGRFLSAAITLDGGVKRRLAAAAQAYAERGEPMPGITATPAVALDAVPVEVAP